MAAGFEDLGLYDCFDSVHGSSAGACGGAYFAAGQARFGGAVYYEDINNRRFVNYLRPLIGKPIMDTDFLISEVMQHRKPLLVDRIIENPGLMNVVMTRADTGEATTINCFKSSKHFFDVLAATIHLPVIAGREAFVEGEPFLDGGLTHQIALESAQCLGATHAIIGMTRKEGDVERRDRTRGFSFEAAVLKACYGKDIETLFRRRNNRINDAVAAVRKGQTDEGMMVDGLIRLPSSVDIERLTTDGSLLKRGFDEGVSTAVRYSNGARMMP
jgi:predicted patatin/cPLA2 family phospholipase